MSSIKFISPLISRHALKLRRSTFASSRSDISADGNWSLGTFTRTMATAKKCLNLEDLNPNVKVMEYAVRGPLVIRAAELEKELAKVKIEHNRRGTYVSIELRLVIKLTAWFTRLFYCYNRIIWLESLRK